MFSTCGPPHGPVDSVKGWSDWTAHGLRHSLAVTTAVCRAATFTGLSLFHQGAVPRDRRDAGKMWVHGRLFVVEEFSSKIMRGEVEVG